MADEIRAIPAQTALDASVSAPPSKAYTLRAIFLASLANGKSVLKNPLLAEDQLHAINAMRALGAKIEIESAAGSNSLVVHGTGGMLKAPKDKIFVGNSGLSMRFLASIASLAEKGKTVELDGDERMRQRPVGELLKALRALGVKAESVNNGCPPILVQGGTLAGGKARMHGGESSQFFSSILVAAPYAQKKVELECISAMSSKPYVDITIDCMKSFSVNVQRKGYKKFAVSAGQSYKARTLNIEGDYSSASYFFAAAAILGGNVRVKNLNPESVQGDKAFLGVLKKMGCKVMFGKDFVEVQGPKKGGNGLKGISVNMNSLPDMVPTLAVVAAFAKGKTLMTGIGHLSIKESDRIKAPAHELAKMGIKAVAGRGSLAVFGGSPHGAEIETYNDHRIAMAFAIAGLKVAGVKIRNPSCVRKSYPDFFSALATLHEK